MFYRWGYLDLDSEVQINIQSIFQGEGELLRQYLWKGKGRVRQRWRVSWNAVPEVASQLYKALGIKDGPSKVSQVGIRRLTWSLHAN